MVHLQQRQNKWIKPQLQQCTRLFFNGAYRRYIHCCVWILNLICIPGTRAALNLWIRIFTSHLMAYTVINTVLYAANTFDMKNVNLSIDCRINWSYQKMVLQCNLRIFTQNLVLFSSSWLIIVLCSLSTLAVTPVPLLTRSFDFPQNFRWYFVWILDT